MARARRTYDSWTDPSTLRCGRPTHRSARRLARRRALESAPVISAPASSPGQAVQPGRACRNAPVVGPGGARPGPLTRDGGRGGTTASPGNPSPGAVPDANVARPRAGIATRAGGTTPSLGRCGWDGGAPTPARVIGPPTP